MLVSLARLMVLEPADAIALPTAVTVCANKVGMTETAFVNECISNKPLRDYVATICRQTMNEVGV